MNPPNYPTNPLKHTLLDQVDPTPQRGGPHHRRAHSDTTFRFSGDEEDDFLFDIDSFNLSSLDIIPPSPSPLPMPVDSSKSDESSGDNRSSSTSSRMGLNPPALAPHLRSLSVDADFFDGVSFGAGSAGVERKIGGQRMVGGHRRTNSMDGGSSSSSMMNDGDSMMIDGVKKAMPPEKLAELALIDPKRAKRYFLFPYFFSIFFDFYVFVLDFGLGFSVFTCLLHLLLSLLGCFYMIQLLRIVVGWFSL